MLCWVDEWVGVSGLVNRYIWVGGLDVFCLNFK